MIKVTLIESIFPIGHKALNNNFLKLLSGNDIELLVINNQNYFLKSECNNIKYLNLKLIRERKSHKLNIIFNIINDFIIRLYLINIKDQIRVHLTFDTIAFAINQLFYSNRRHIIVHHNNTDQLSYSLYNKLFKLYMNKVEHIVFADFIKDRLIEVGVFNKNIHILPHPLPHHNNNFRTKSILGKKNIVGLGYSSDSKLMKSIIDFDNRYNILSNNNINLVLRSKEIHSNSSNIKVISNHLSLSDYEELFNSAFAILLLYPMNFDYRYSGIILDALRHKKFVIGTDIKIMRHFNELYPNECIIFKDLHQLFEIISVQNNKCFGDETYKEFIEYHSNENIRKEIKNIFFRT